MDRAQAEAPPAGAATLDDRIGLRPAAADERALLLAIYASTRAREMARVPWSEEQKAGFLSMQFEAQDRHYRTYPNPEFLLIVRRGEPAGRLYLCRTARELRIMDITLLPPFRGAGIGGAILRDLQEQARAGGQSLTIHVEPDNPARTLYARLGFTQTQQEQRGINILMTWQAPRAQAGAAASH